MFPKMKVRLKELPFEDDEKSITDELQKIQKEEFSAAFQKLYDRAKPYIYANGAYVE
jgi:hypothetical protein